jgi:1-acyl-sn-glycerol-3-phosphate acyltransferase
MFMMENKVRHPVIVSLKWLLRLFYHRHDIRGAELVEPGQPVVFVCNHAQSYGPIVMTLELPFRFRPWVQAAIVSRELCRDYLEADFIKKELGLPAPWSRWLASLLAPLCLRLMKGIEAIPVFKGQMRIRETIDLSIGALQAGWNLLIFPESPSEPFSSYINDFQTGFAYLSWRYYLVTGKLLRFHPVYIDRRKRQITIGPAILPKIDVRDRIDWKNLALSLRNTINQMAAKMAQSD